MKKLCKRYIFFTWLLFESWADAYKFQPPRDAASNGIRTVDPLRIKMKRKGLLAVTAAAALSLVTSMVTVTSATAAVNCDPYS